MKITVNIECETINELITHLLVLSKQIRKSARKQKLNPDLDKFEAEDADSLCDNKCIVEIIPEGVREVVLPTYKLIAIVGDGKVPILELALRRLLSNDR